MSPSWPSGALPAADEETAGWWDATRIHQLVAQQCARCGRLQHPPRPLCLGCEHTTMRWKPLSGRGHVDAWTEVHRAASPDMTSPYVVARVRLDDGPLLLTRLIGPGPFRCGAPVAVDWQALEDGRCLPVFRLDEE